MTKRTPKRSASDSAQPGSPQPDSAQPHATTQHATKSYMAVKSLEDSGGSGGSGGSPAGASPPTVSRARELSPELLAEAARATDKTLRIELIHDWMLRGVYLKGRTDKALAEAWGCARSTVWSYSAESVRLLRRDLSEQSREELLASLLAKVSAIGQSALERTEEVVSVKGDVVEVRRPDHRTALRAAEATGELLGLKVQRHEHRVMAEQMTTEQIIEQLKAHGVQVALPITTTTTGEEVAEKDTDQ